MELIINSLRDHDLDMYSDSIANSGRENIGKITWENALECEENFITEENKQEIRDHFASYGAWEEEEISAWSDTELNALLIQFISGDLKEWEEAQELSKDDLKEWEQNQGGRIYLGTDNNLYYYIGE